MEPLPERLREFDPEAFREYEPIQPRGTDWRGLFRKIWAPVAAAIAFGVKFGAVVFKLKFFTFAASMMASAGVYIWIGGIWFGVALIGLLFVHEMGHVLEAKRQGLPVSAPVFIPFLGAAIMMKEAPTNAWREAQVALAGPIVGSAGAAVLWGVGEYYESNYVKALAFLGFLLNLFNLLPIVPLDGGRAVAAIHPALWAVGLVALVGLAIRWHNPILYIIIAIGALELWSRWRSRHSARTQAYYQVKPWQRVTVAAVYLGLAALLVIGMNATHVPRDF